MASAAKSAAGREPEEPAETEAAAPATGKNKSRGPLLIIAGSALASALLASAVTWFAMPKHAAPAKAAAKEAAKDSAEADAPAAADPDAKAAPEQPALYLDMTPAFVVNLADEDAMRFLQVEVEVMARDPKVIDAVKTHTPRIRNALMLLFSQQHAHDISTRQAKEELQKQALAEVEKALQDESAPAEVGAVYFTSFVMQ